MKCRIVGDDLQPLDGEEPGHTEPAIVTTARPNVVHSTEQWPAVADKEQLPKVIRAAGPDGPVCFYRVDVVGRLPAMEAFLEGFGVPATVWAFVHGVKEQGQMVRGVAAQISGRPSIFVNTLRAKCRIHRLAIVAHEAEHVRRGDVQRASGYDAKAEAACDAAAGEMIQRTVKRLARKGATVAVDAASCQRCYEHNVLPCPQGSEVFQEVSRLLADY